MAADWFSKEEHNEIIEAIQRAENLTSGEIRLHLDRRCRDESPLDRAAHLFANLGMHKTEERNGVLIYLALEDHQFAIIGDAGINHKVPADFWGSTIEIMKGHFVNGDLLKGIISGIEEAGLQLRKFFPVREDDINELSDEISFGE